MTRDRANRDQIPAPALGPQRFPVPTTPSTMDSSPTALFDSYEQDFQQILQSIRQKLEGDGSDQRGGTLETTHPIRSPTKPHLPSRAEEGGPAPSRDGTRRGR